MPAITSENQKFSTKDHLPSKLINIPLSPEQIKSNVSFVFQSVIDSSKNIYTGNFDRISYVDLKMMFEFYDSVFFNNQLQMTIENMGYPPMVFKLSRRMTSAAGKISWYPKKSPSENLFTLTFAIDLLFKQFNSGETSAYVNGLPVSNRLEALQRVFEHELVHLLELLIWGDSNDKASRFHTIAKGLFGHKEFTHDLITWKKEAKSDFGIRIGSSVSFTFEGKLHTGIVNNITKRATVLVENPNGVLYKSGKKYFKYYIPIKHLTLL